MDELIVAFTAHGKQLHELNERMRTLNDTVLELNRSLQELQAACDRNEVELQPPNFNTTVETLS